ncbi:MAG: peptidylprolyl isomerase, partial [Paludibacteraceae bacterium]|nr:peptidylprolyl isomerase [Paludibacteraceae bacterium]
MKIKSAILAAAALLISAASFSKGKVIDQIVWVIGNEAILQSDIETEILRQKYEKVNIDGDPRCVIPEQIALQKLF